MVRKYFIVHKSRCRETPGLANSTAQCHYHGSRFFPSSFMVFQVVPLMATIWLQQCHLSQLNPMSREKEGSCLSFLLLKRRKTSHLISQNLNPMSLSKPVSSQRNGTNACGSDHTRGIAQSRIWCWAPKHTAAGGRWIPEQVRTLLESGDLHTLRWDGEHKRRTSSSVLGSTKLNQLGISWYQWFSKCSICTSSMSITLELSRIENLQVSPRPVESVF